MQDEIAYVGLGSNLGDREARLTRAVEALCELAGVQVDAASPVFETDPVGPPPQGPYLNAVVRLRTALAADVLLAAMLAIESAEGRVRGGDRDSARTLDLDLLLYGDHCIDRAGLVVPHPRLHERAFVLEPLACLEPELLHPRLGSAVSVLAEAVRDPLAVRPYPLKLIVPS